MNQRCLVLGANGFIGSYITECLVRDGYKVRAFDRFPKGELAINFAKNNEIEIVSGNFLNRSDLKDALKDVDYVFHLISTTTPVTSEENPLIDVETNIKNTIELLQECVDAKIKKVVYISTGGAIYGLNSSMNVSEDVTPLPVSPYAIGKLTIEHYLRYFSKKHDLNSVVYRLSNPYGGRQPAANKQGVIPIFLRRILEGKPLQILGDGSMVRDYIYVEDAAKMVCGSFKDAKQDLYNIGSGSGVEINKIVAIIKEIPVMKQFSIEYSPTPKTYVDTVTLNINRFTSEFGIHPLVSLSEGITRTWDSIRQEYL